jgi:hypothetical protein
MLPLSPGEIKAKVSSSSNNGNYKYVVTYVTP